MRNTTSFIMVALVGITAARAAFAGDSDQLLRGDYAFTQLNVCVATASGSLPPTFDRTTLQLVGDSRIETSQSEGVTRFDGNGNWTSSGRAMAFFLDQLTAGGFPVVPPGAGFSCAGTYSVNPDRSFSLEGSCETAAPPVLTFDPLALSGQVSIDRKTLIFFDVEPVIEEISVGGFVFAERICTAMATDVRLVPAN